MLRQPGGVRGGCYAAVTGTGPNPSQKTHAGPGHRRTGAPALERCPPIPGL